MRMNIDETRRDNNDPLEEKKGKNIVICCDGTGNVIGENHSNVVKLVRSILQDKKQQCVFYDPGLGTMSAPGALTGAGKAFTRALGLAVGFGIHHNMREAYQFLMNHYEEGDRVFLFGFSRGAYTVCSLAGVLNRCGLLDKGNDNLIDLALQTYQNSWKSVEEAKATRLFKATFGRECKPHFLGIWDTVASVGWLMNGNPFPSANANPDVRFIRHAVSIDERRLKFQPELWQTPQDVREDQDVKEVWFAGVHSDVGGGYHEKESGLSKLALHWMISEAVEQGLQIDEHKCIETLGIKKEMMKVATRGSKTDFFLTLPKEYNEIVVSPDPGGPMHNSLRGFWIVLDSLLALFSFRKFGARRQMPENALIHESVLRRWKDLNALEDKNGRYAPENLSPAIERLPNDWELAFANAPQYGALSSSNGQDANIPDWVVTTKTIPYTTVYESERKYDHDRDF